MTPAPKPQKVLPPTDTAAAQASADAAQQARQRSAKGYSATNLRAGSLLQQYAQQLTKMQTGASVIINADARHIPLADNSVQCVVTSPPYWGLRDYGTATWAGGDEGHAHDRVAARNGRGGSGSPGKQTVDAFPSDLPAEICSCGATRIDSQIGLEATPEEYVAKIVAVFAEVWRVLRDDGTCWVNLGDSYNSIGHKKSNSGYGTTGLAGGIAQEHSPTYRENSAPGLKHKDLCGVPWRVAFALQAAGWYLRSDIIWSKPNPMPESVTDRPTKAHEYIFLLTKRERYYFDQDAVREESCDPPGVGRGGSLSRAGNDDFVSWKNHKGQPSLSNGTRNIRTVWEIATQPYPNAHFATFPEEIAIRCILAGTSERGACAECGAPWERVTETEIDHFTGGHKGRGVGDKNGMTDMSNIRPAVMRTTTLGWQRACKHDALTVPCVVLDPFSGAGTVPLVADKLNRRGIGLELKADYCRMAHDRCYDDAPLLGYLRSVG